MSVPPWYDREARIRTAVFRRKEALLLHRFWTFPPVRFVREVVTLFLSRRIPQAAACLAYFMLLTIFPLLICVSHLLGLANIDISTTLSHLHILLPDEAIRTLSNYLRYISYHDTSGLFIAGLVGCWFSAAAAYRNITRVILDVYDHVSQSLLRNLISSILFPFGLLITLDLSVVVVVTGQKTLGVLAGHIPFLTHFLSLWGWLRYVLLFAIFFLFILAILIMASPKGPPRAPMMAGSLLATLALVVSSAVFSRFIEMSSRYSLVYGSLVSIIILLVWLYLCGYILFLAIVCSGVFYKNHVRDKT